MPVSRFAIVGLVLISASLVGYAQADAHAILERSDPPAYRLLLKPPERIVLWFSEPVDARGTEIKVLDQDGRRVEQQGLQLSADRRQASLPVRVPGPGIYTVAWRTLSLVDQHTYEGFFTITAGPLRPGSFTLQGGVPAGPSPWEVATRWLMFLGMAILGGGLLIHRFLLPPTLRPRQQGADSWLVALHTRWHAAAWVGAAIFFTGVIGELAFQAGRAAQAAGEAFGTSLILLATGEPVRTSLLVKIIAPVVLLTGLGRRAPAGALCEEASNGNGLGTSVC